MQLTKAAFLSIVALAYVCSAQTKYFAGIDVGSRGIRASLFAVTATTDDREIEVLFEQTINTHLVSSMEDKRFTETGIREATVDVAQLVNRVKAKAQQEGVADVTYYIVGRSSVALSENRDVLAANIRSATNIDVEFIDSKAEEYLGFESAVPPAKQSTSMYVDIGSGNTKLGCLVNSDLLSYESTMINFGSVSGRIEGLKRNPGNFAAGIEDLMKDIRIIYKKDSGNTPCLTNRQRIYWTGGAAWATATFTHPEMALLPRVSIARRDLDTFLEALKDGTWNQSSQSITFRNGTPLQLQAEVRQKAEKDRQDVTNLFVREDLISGISIMKAILEGSNPSAVIVFARQSSAIYGFASSKYIDKFLVRIPILLASVFTLATDQIYLLKNWTNKLHVRTANLRKAVDGFGQSNLSTVHATLEQYIDTAIQTLSSDESEILARFPNGETSSYDKRITQTFFDDLRLNYAAVLKQLPSKRARIGQVFPQIWTRPAFFSIGSDQTSNGNASLVVGNTLSAFEENELAYRVAADSGSLMFDLKVNSTPEGAAIQYRRRGDQYRTNSEGTNSTIGSLPFAIWTVRIHIPGYEDQEIEHDPFRQRDHVINVILTPEKH